MGVRALVGVARARAGAAARCLVAMMRAVQHTPESVALTPELVSVTCVYCLHHSSPVRQWPSLEFLDSLEPFSINIKSVVCLHYTLLNYYPTVLARCELGILVRPPSLQVVTFKSKKVGDNSFNCIL